MYQNTIIVGHLGTDPEMRYTSAGKPVTNFSVAVNRRWTGADGEAKEKTTWFRVNAWGQLAETCNQYLKKGRLVLVEGEVDAAAWTDNAGELRASLELRANNVKFLGRPTEGEKSSEPVATDDEDEGDLPF